MSSERHFIPIPMSIFRVFRRPPAVLGTVLFSVTGAQVTEPPTACLAFAPDGNRLAIVGLGPHQPGSACHRQAGS